MRNPWYMRGDCNDRDVVVTAGKRTFTFKLQGIQAGGENWIPSRNDWILTYRFQMAD